jgi:Protein of unknown function (DUF2721)
MSLGPQLPDLSTLTPALAVLTAMITPAVLMLACGALIGSTSQRLIRVVDRVRGFSDEFTRLVNDDSDSPLPEAHRIHIISQLDKLTRRARLLQFSMTAFYLALASYVLSSVAIGLLTFVSLDDDYSRYIPVAVALIGMTFLFTGSMLLIFEARLAIYAVHEEMNYIWKLAQNTGPSRRLRDLGESRQVTGRSASGPDVLAPGP